MILSFCKCQFLEELLWLGEDDLGAVLYELLLGAEAPEDADGQEAGVDGCIHIDARVAEVSNFFGFDAVFLGHHEDFLRVRLDGQARAVAHDGRERASREHAADDLVSCLLVLVGADTHRDALRFELVEHRLDARERARVVAVVLVDGLIALHRLDDEGLVGGLLLRQRTLDEFLGAIAEVVAVFV